MRRLSTRLRDSFARVLCRLRRRDGDRRGRRSNAGERRHPVLQVESSFRRPGYFNNMETKVMSIRTFGNLPFIFWSCVGLRGHAGVSAR